MLCVRFDREKFYVPAPRRRALRQRLGRDWAVAYPFMLPMLAVLVGLVAYPFVSAIWLSLTSKFIGGQGQFIGLGNYRRLVLDPTFQKSVEVSTVYTVGAVVIKLVLGMVAALVLREALPPRNFWRMLLFLPWCVPVVINAYTWRWIYDDLSGILSQTLLRWGLADHYIFWLANPSLALKSVIAVEVWQGTPFYMMTFLAGLAAIPAELYEAAAVDGAGAIRRFAHVTVPSLMPVIIIVVLLSTIWTANNMQIVYVLTRGGPNGASNIFPYMAYHTAIEARNLGLGAAIPLTFFPVMVVIIYVLTGRMLRQD